MIINTRPSPFLLLMIILACGLTLSCDQRKASTKNVVASVNGKPITQEDIAFAARSTPGGHQQSPEVDKASVLENLIVQELAYQRAVEHGLDADPEYQTELRSMEAQVNAFKRKKLSEIFLQREMQQKTGVSDAEIQEYFNKNAARLNTDINVWQILSRNENTIRKIQAELAQGVPFEAVAAKQFPNLPKAAPKPWELGYLQWSQVPEVWDAVYNMKVGETSDIISGPNHRFWIIKLIDKRENKALTLEQVKPRIVEILKAEKNQQLRETTIKNLKQNAKIEYSTENMESAKTQTP